MTYRERRLAKAERLQEWAEKRERKSNAAFASARTIADGIPLGQPILVGHHSERRPRRDIARIDSGMRRGIEHQDKAHDMQSRAAGIIAAADRAIYSDDPDAVEALTAKLAGLEAERERAKDVNKIIRKIGLQEALPQLTDAEKRDLLSTMRAQPYYQVEKRGYPAYHLTNLGGNITRTRQRLARLQGTPAPVDAPTSGATATERAGITVIATMTTPSRPGKKPRPVWNVGGNVGPFRAMLQSLGGTWYRGAFSFWDDPAADIEQALAEREATRTDAIGAPLGADNQPLDAHVYSDNVCPDGPLCADESCRAERVARGIAIG